MTDTNHYPIEQVRRLAADLAAAAGVPSGDAVVLADALADADLHGVSTHGVSRLNIYLKRIRLGLIDPKAELSIERRRPAVLAVNANHGLGQVQASKVLDELIPLAREHGVASATIRRSQHFGALSHYCNRAAAEGMILLATSNGEPAMSPAGGREPIFGTNPIAASFPTGKGWTAKIDLATSIVARGRIIAANKEGAPIPEDWAVDPDGEPTTDAEAALAGSVLTMAGHKGYALALMVEVLSSVLSGSAMAPDVGSMYKHMDRRQDVGHFFCLLDIDAFMDRAEFIQRIDDTIDRIKSSRKRPGVEEIFIPGERSAATARRSERRGVPIGPATLDELRTLCKESNVEFSLSPGDARFNVYE